MNSLIFQLYKNLPLKWIWIFRLVYMIRELCLTIECDFHQTLLNWTWKVLTRLVFIYQHSLQGQKCPVMTTCTQFQMYTNLTYLWVLMREITLVVTSECKKHLLYFLRLDRIKWLNFCSSETVDQSLSIQNFRSYPLMPKPNLHGKQK